MCKIRKFETLVFCANKKKFSFRWIEEQFVHPGENVSESDPQMLVKVTPKTQVLILYFQ